MKQYLSAFISPTVPSPPEFDRYARRQGAAREMKKAGAWVFTAGLHPGTATVVRQQGGWCL